jgi:hypothetical protein
MSIGRGDSDNQPRRKQGDMEGGEGGEGGGRQSARGGSDPALGIACRLGCRRRRMGSALDPPMGRIHSSCRTHDEDEVNCK